MFRPWSGTCYYMASMLWQSETDIGCSGPYPFPLQGTDSGRIRWRIWGMLRVHFCAASVVPAVGNLGLNLIPISSRLIATEQPSVSSSVRTSNRMVDGW
ncbi:hypothetical protein B0T26DRAFT_729428 [Lasiosphaeria miniovina]|uniref:Uncharacterized protein n=1 Tax=Lasiosphaeria miniovina TaxID=1954250 RepID=A0AA39ZSR6_9PEZI|nr:uncharacterized protein B0T26DRAFT_729428 [Lasiosphaeria miniovina]KAK0702956.1 hypothetical protein B0T26DRAFT_729428 [Lasiosphaeria miniovina]